jgi:hypothetical protein
MQSKNLHLERVTLQAIDEVIEMVRKSARLGVRAWKYGASPEELRALNEFLLRPIRAQVEALKASGLSLVEKSPAQEARERAE